MAGRVVLRTILLATVLSAMVSAVPAGAAPGDPIGSIDSVSIAGSSGQSEPADNDRITTHFVFGWSADPEGDAGYTDIHLYLDGRLTDLGNYSRHDRPDVRQVHPWVGQNVGWQASVTWPAGQRGSHRVCAYALNQGAGQNNTFLGCITVSAGAKSPGDPKGHLDLVDSVPGLARVVGWAGDPDSGYDDAGNRVPTRVRVYYDGRPMTEVLASNPRPDVSAVFPELPAATGFDAALPMTPGRHHVCLYALNLGRTGRQNTTVGCTTLVSPSEPPPTAGSPRGSVDEIRHQSGYFSDLAFVRGWAHDLQGDPGVSVFALNYSDYGFGIPRVVHAKTDQPRPDVASATGAPTDTGFDVNVSGGKYFTRVRLVCVVAGDIGAGGAPAGTRLIGCLGE